MSNPYWMYDQATQADYATPDIDEPAITDAEVESYPDGESYDDVKAQRDELRALVSDLRSMLAAADKVMDQHKKEIYRLAAERDVALNRLTGFLYVLLRDEVTTGVIERIMVEHVEKLGDQTAWFSNHHLAAYARELASRLTAGNSTIANRGQE